MAFVHTRRGGKIYVYYNDRGNKLRQVKRKYTKHLDGQPLDVAEKWVADWERKHGRTVDRVERSQLSEDDKLSQLWKAYQAQVESDSERPRRARTIENENRAFFTHVVHFFVGKHGKKLPTQWHALVPDFHAHLAALKLSPEYRSKILWTLERFSAYLVFAQHMSFPFVVRPPKLRIAKVTPLKVRLAPEELLAWEKTATFKLPQNSTLREEHFRLMVLLGYFAALTPGELFPLSKSDLRAGAEAEKESKTAAGWRKHGLGSKLVVAVEHGFENGQVVKYTKNDHRKALVSIWHPEAAKRIAAIVKTLGEGRLFPLAYDTLTSLWSRHVGRTLHCTPHDLRRASCLYLGRTLRLEPTFIQEHMRHSQLDTTMLYMREPAIPDAPKKKPLQDFDDVA